MRDVPSAMTEAWKAPDKVGPRKPVVRATIQKGHMRKFEYNTAQMQGGVLDTVRDKASRGVYTSMVFGDFTGQREIRNIKSYTWSRSLDQDVATCSMTIQNSDITPIGNPDENDPNGEFDLPGYFTFNRGDQKVSANRWGFEQNGWNHVFVPDAIVKTYEGYGSNESVVPGDDENLMQSGVWLIDKVTYTADGDINIEMRDLGRLLLDQIVFPPVIPFENYPLAWSKLRTEQVKGRDATGGEWKQLRGLGKASSSNDLYVGMDIDDGVPGKYVTKGGGVQGHLASHALVNTQVGDENDSWWLSTGQETQASRVWWEVDLDNSTALNALRIQTKYGPYRIFISLMGPNGWIGRKKIPYEVTTEGVDLGAGIPFVKQVRAESGAPFDVILPRVYGSVTKIRLTFTRLWDSKVGNYPFHAGLRDLQIYTASNGGLGFAEGTVLKTVGNYRDYTDLVKWVAAWGGFYWPPHSTGADFIKVGADKRYITYASRESKLAKGRAWGDFMNTGTAGAADLTVDTFDKKPLMDIINYVRDLTGFVFFIDEVGGVTWRMPNMGLGNWQNKLGNWKSPSRFGQYTRARTGEIVTIDEEETLLNYSTTLDSANIRERIFVANVTGKVGTVIRGFNPFPNGMRRVAGWTDQHFKDKRDVRVMADMIAARSMFEYRRSQVTIPGYPAIQMDDQIRIFERMTNETYYHYVLGITSTLDMERGTWDYEMETHWLGERPSDAWVVSVDQLDAATKSYLNLLGTDE